MKKTLLLIAIVVGVGCGIKGPPLPPLETVNDRTNNINADSDSVSEVSSAKTRTISGDNTTIKKDSSK